MAQGWSITGTGITFMEPPPEGTGNITVTQRGAGGNGGTDVFALGAWGQSVGYPTELEFFGDRLWLGGTPADPQVLWASCTGDYTNFGKSSPMVDSDAITVAINSRQVNVIKELVPLDSLLVLTTGGEYRVGGGGDDVVTPSSVSIKNQGNSGTGDVAAKVIGESALFLQAEGQKVRDLRYQFEKDGFRGNDVGVWADHLFTGHAITGIDYWKAPWQVVWYMRDDGVRLGCTYMPEQEVSGWHWHDTDGAYIDACTLPGDLESGCYYLVERSSGIGAVRCIEAQAPTFFNDEADMFYVDSGLTYDGRLAAAGATVTLDAIDDDWSEEGDIRVTASAARFSIAGGDVGDGIQAWIDVPGEDGAMSRVDMRLVIDQVLSATVAICRPMRDVPVEMRGVPLAGWIFQRDTIGGLWHLEGKVVKVLQDGAEGSDAIVTGGKIKLQHPGGVVHVGLSYAAEVETLELNAPGGEPMRDQMKLAYRASILVNGTRGVEYCEMGGSDWYPVAERSSEPYGTAPYLKSGVIDMSIPTVWNEDAGRVRIRSTAPLPMELLSITIRAASSPGQAAGR